MKFRLHAVALGALAVLAFAKAPAAAQDMKASASYELVSQEEGQDEQGRKTFVHLVRRKA